MTELDTIKRAKMYMEKLAEGIDPIHGTVISEGEVAVSPRMTRCFTYIAGLLERIIENGGVDAGNMGEVLPIWTEEVLSRYTCSPQPITMTEMVKKRNGLAGMSFYCKLSYCNVVEWLVKIVAIERKGLEDGRHKYVPTEQNPVAEQL